MDLPRIPCSDGAGVVIASGKNVTQFKEGDKVCTLFNQLHQAGPCTPKVAMTGLGGPVDGTLRRHAVFPEHGLVRSPTTLSLVEASTLPCAPLTAWNCLFGLESKAVKPGDIVLTQGTGGVSLSAIQFALAAGATVIATTSSNEKAEKLQKLGVHHVINYKSTPNWGAIAKDLTPGKLGVDHIVEVGGAATLRQSLNAIKMEGVITVVGFLTGAGDGNQPTMAEILGKCTVRGIVVGSKQMFEAMNRAIDANSIHPVVDETHFRLEEAATAFQYQWEQKNYGKVVIRV
jgi:NADPH:quinone reductase-like Zn-dependent oxidoreductase